MDLSASECSAPCAGPRCRDCSSWAGRPNMTTKKQLEAIVTNDVAKLQESVLLSPPQLLERAIANGAGVDVIERLLGLQERWEANQARKAFNSAIAAFKANPPEILKTEEVGFDSRRTGDRTSYKHEDLAKMLAVVDPALAVHGLWARFKVKGDDPDKITVTCVLGHVDGHVEEGSTLSGKPDTSGNKNPLQAIGSTTA